ncbi:hypothetical protein ACWGIU_14345, partial [Streptomyces sp. NPDC054840]
MTGAEPAAGRVKSWAGATGSRTAGSGATGGGEPGPAAVTADRADRAGGDLARRATADPLYRLVAYALEA